MLEKIYKMFPGYLDSDENGIQPFTIKQLKRPVIFVSYLYGIAMLIFLAECIVYKWKDWRDRKQVPI